MNRDALDVAVAVAPNLGLRPGTADERVVRGHAAIVVQSNQLAVVIGQVLRRVRLEVALGWNLPVAERQPEIAVPVERNLAAVVVAPR